METWIEEKMERNRVIAEQLLPALQILKSKYPEDKDTINDIIDEIADGYFNDEYLLEIRNSLRRLVSKNEYNLIRKKDDIREINSLVKRIENSFRKEKKPLTDNCFFDGFDFKKTDSYYYLKLPKLHVYSDKNEKSEWMLDRYIRDFLSNSLTDFQYESNETFEKYQTFTIIFLHHITPENAKKFDTDNIEIKKPIDGINGRLIENDTAERSDIFQIVVPDNSEFTEMFVVKGQSLGRSIIKLLNDANQ